MELKKQVDVCVVGAGHAGCEAALACARLGLKTVIFTVSLCVHKRIKRNIPEPCVKCWKIRKIF